MADDLFPTLVQAQRRGAGVELSADEVDRLVIYLRDQTRFEMGLVGLGWETSEGFSVVIQVLDRLGSILVEDIALGGQGSDDIRSLGFRVIDMAPALRYRQLRDYHDFLKDTQRTTP